MNIVPPIAYLVVFRRRPIIKLDNRPEETGTSSGQTRRAGSRWRSFPAQGRANAQSSLRSGVTAATSKSALTRANGGPLTGGHSHMAGKRILLLEDEADIAELLALALDGEGYVVDLAATVAEARTRLDTLVYFLVIADLRLPDGDGLEIAERAADLGAATFIM